MNPLLGPLPAREKPVQDGEVQARLSAVVVGGLVCMVMQLALTLLGSGFGLSLIDLRGGSVPGNSLALGAAVFVLISLVFSFFTGGYISGRLADQRTKFSAGVHGLAVFALVSLSAVFFVGTNIAPAVGGLIPQTGVSAGSASGLETVLKDIRKDIVKMRFVTDLKILKGKAVTRIALSGSGEDNAAEQAINKTEDNIEQTGKDKKLAAETKDTAQNVDRAAAKVSLVVFCALAIGALSGIFGGLCGVRQKSENNPGKA